MFALCTKMCRQKYWLKNPPGSSQALKVWWYVYNTRTTLWSFSETNYIKYDLGMWKMKQKCVCFFISFINYVEEKNVIFLSRIRTDIFAFVQTNILKRSDNHNLYNLNSNIEDSTKICLHWYTSSFEIGKKNKNIYTYSSRTYTYSLLVDVTNLQNS
jgi:hypothetical protein